MTAAIIVVIGVLLGGSLLAMLWMSVLSFFRRFAQRRLEGQAEQLRKLLASSREKEYEGLAKVLFDMRDTFDPEVLDAQLQKELAACETVSPRLLATVTRLGLPDRYLEQVTDATTWRARAQAAHSLGAIGEPRAAAPLVTAMRDPREDRDVKMACAEALGRIRNPDVIPLLCEQLGDIDEWASPRIAAILTNFGDDAVEPLLATLDNAESLNARIWSAQILGKLGARSAVPALRDRLHDRSEQMRLSAANALGDIGDLRAVRSMIDVALRDPTPAVRAQAAQGLGKLGDLEALPILVAALGDPEYWMRFRALEAIEALAPENLESIESALGDTSPEVRRRAALALERLGVLDEAFAALGRAGDEAQVARERLTAVGRAGLSERFIRHLTDESAVVRENVAHLLGDVGEPNHAGDLVKRLADEEAPVRRAAAAALGALAVVTTAPTLIKLLDDRDPELATIAVASLKRFDPESLSEYVDLLIALLSSESDSARVRAIEVLADVPSDEIDELLQKTGLADRFVDVRLAAVRALGERHCEAAVDAIGGALADPFEPLRVAAAVALSEIGGDRAIDLLLARMPRAGRDQRDAICRGIAALGYDDLGPALDILLGSVDVNARVGAAWALGKTGESRAVPLLAALLFDSEPRVRSSAAGALAKIEDASALSGLREAHDDPNQFVRAAVVNAVGARGDADDTDLLVARLADPDGFVRNRAVIAMGRIGAEGTGDRIRGAHDNCEEAFVLVALGLCGDPEAIGDAVAALGSADSRERVSEVLGREDPLVRQQFIANLGVVHAPDPLREAFVVELDPGGLISRLIHDLRNHNREGERLRALRSLARLRTKEATMALAATVSHDPSPRLRRGAVDVLASRASDVDAARVLVAAVRDPDIDVRATAIVAVGNARNAEHGPLLLEGLGSTDERVAGASVTAVAACYAEDVDALRTWFDAVEKPGEIIGGLRVLAELNEDTTLELITPHALSARANVRRQAVITLACFGHTDAARLVLDRISDPDPGVRREAIARAPKSARTLVELRRASVDPDPSVRGVCAERLGLSHDLAAIEMLEALAADRDADVAARALGALLGLHAEEAREAFVRAAADVGEEVRARTLRDSLPAIEAVAADIGAALSLTGRLAAVRALAAFRSVTLADEIAAGLGDPEPDVRLEAARGLAAIGVEKLQDRLKTLLDDPVADVRAEARRLLIRPV